MSGHDRSGVIDALRDRNKKSKAVFEKEAFVKYERLWTALVFSLMVALTSCGNENETITVPNPGPQIIPEATGLLGTFSGTVQNTIHTKSGTLTISITAYDRSSGLLTGTLTLTGFSECFTKGIFPGPGRNNNYDNHYLPQRGFGSIIATGPQPDSFSFLYFLPSDDFNKGLNLNGITETLAFNDGRNWCLEIDPVVLKKQ